MATEAPRAFNRHIFDNQKVNVFYGTDDGFQDGSFSEFPEFVNHYQAINPARHENIHMVSVVGGLYGLNLIPLWQPESMTFFDINPAAIAYFQIICRVWKNSRDAKHFLSQLTEGTYDADTELEQFIRENISLKQKGCLPRERGSSKRSYEDSWKYALEHFDLTKHILTESPLEIRTEPMESDSFREWIRQQNNLWIFASNITQFHFFDLEFLNASNVVILQTTFPEKTELLDLASLAGSPVKVKFEIPLKAERIN